MPHVIWDFLCVIFLSTPKLELMGLPCFVSCDEWWTYVIIERILTDLTFESGSQDSSKQNCWICSMWSLFSPETVRQHISPQTHKISQNIVWYFGNYAILVGLTDLHCLMTILLHAISVTITMLAGMDETLSNLQSFYKTVLGVSLYLSCQRQFVLCVDPHS